MCPCCVMISLFGHLLYYQNHPSMTTKIIAKVYKRYIYTALIRSRTCKKVTISKLSQNLSCFSWYVVSFSLYKKSNVTELKNFLKKVAYKKLFNITCVKWKFGAFFSILCLDESVIVSFFPENSMFELVQIID